MSLFVVPARRFLIGAGMAAVITLSAAGLAQQQKLPVSFEMAFRDGEPKLTLSTGKAGGWLDDAHFLWTDRDEEGKSQTFKVRAEDGRREPYQTPAGPDHAHAQPAATGHQARVWVQDGDLYYQHIDDKDPRRLTETQGLERNPQLSPDGRWIAYTRDHDLHAWNLDTSSEHRLTEDGSDTVYNGYASWVYYEEILGRSSRHRAFWWSPDSQRLVFLRFDDGPVPIFSIYHEEGAYGSVEETRYPKAGAANPLVRAGVIEVAASKTVWMDFDEKKDAYLAWPFWLPDSRRLHLQWLNRDQNHLVIYECDAQSGVKKTIYEEKQPSWVTFFEDISYLSDGSGFLLRSDKDGRRHLFLHHMDGSLRKRLTSGNWDVKELLAIDSKAGKVYFMANPEDSGGQDLYVVDLDGSHFKRLTEAGGTHRVTLSPGFTYFLDQFSDLWTPEQTRLHRMDGTLIRVLADTRNPEVDRYRTGTIEYFKIPSTDGVSLPAKWVLPPDMDRSGNTRYGVIFRIYGGPGSSTATNRWRWRWRDHYYATQGIITLSVDHRGSGHFGKAGTALMHRKLGHWEIHDLSQAAQWLREQPFIDDQRMGITGGSYGGYATLLALTRAGDYFTHGIAGAPVTDWALYDTVYTERYMDHPRENPEGYQQGSVLTHAKNLKGALRLVHGAIDDNVHLQNSLQLIAILTAEDIPFELMVYPGSRHGVRQRRHYADGNNAFWFRHFLARSFRP